MKVFDRREGERRIRRLYAGRDAAGLRQLYAGERGEVIAWRESRHRAMVEALAWAGIDMAGRGGARRALDVGCGTGGLLADLVTLGADPAGLVGLDLLLDRLKEGRRAYPDLPLVLGSGWSLPIRDATFDLVTLFTVLSSLPDPEARAELGREVRRVVRSGGHALVYDFRVRRPGRNQLVGIGRRDVESALDAPVLWRRSLTLAPPLARLIGRFGPTGVRTVERVVPALRTHRMYLVQL